MPTNTDSNQDREIKDAEALINKMDEISDIAHSVSTAMGNLIAIIEDLDSQIDDLKEEKEKLETLLSR